MLNNSMWDYEKSSMVTYPCYFINWQSMHKTSSMQIIKKILMWEVLPAIALINNHQNVSIQMCNVSFW